MPAGALFSRQTAYERLSARIEACRGIPRVISYFISGSALSGICVSVCG